jgi:dihydroorotate dehydrogenase (fumarate)
MANLQTSYLGIELKNPIIVGASNMVNDIENLKKMEEAGAAAIVYKSLFEEQIQLERLELDDTLSEYEERHAEMISLFPDIEHAGPSEHLMNLRMAKESVSIPVIASLNCIFTDTWLEYAKLIQDTGVDAIELNFYFVPRDGKYDGRTINDQQVEVLKGVKSHLKIPVSVKLSPFYANPINVIKNMDAVGSDGYILFNRFLQPDIDIEYETHINHFSASSQEENRLALRVAGLIYGQVAGSICCSGGVHTGHDVVKMILAGADSVQVVSTLYKNKISYISTMLKDLNDWMDSKGYKKLHDFQGKLSQKNVHDPLIYKRAQYIDMILKSSELFKRYTLR